MLFILHLILERHYGPVTGPQKPSKPTTWVWGILHGTVRLRMRGVILIHRQGGDEAFVVPVIIDLAESPFFVNIESKTVLLPL